MTLSREEKTNEKIRLYGGFNRHHLDIRYGRIMAYLDRAQIYEDALMIKKLISNYYKKCFEAQKEAQKKDHCDGLVGGTRETGYLQWDCISCPHRII